MEIAPSLPIVHISRKQFRSSLKLVVDHPAIDRQRGQLGLSLIILYLPIKF